MIHLWNLTVATEGYLDHHCAIIVACSHVKNEYKDPWCFQISALHVRVATEAKLTRQHIHGGGFLDDVTWKHVDTPDRVEFSLVNLLSPFYMYITLLF